MRMQIKFCLTNYYVVYIIGFFTLEQCVNFINNFPKSDEDSILKPPQELLSIGKRVRMQM